MKKRIFIGIGLLLILLPLTSSSSIVNTSASTSPSVPESPEIDDIAAGTKLIYDITTFEYGDGIWDVLDMLLSQSGGPSFDKGLVGTLQGSEFIVYITATGDITLYKYNYTDYTYYDPITLSAEQVFGFIKLNSDISAYANVSQFSFPDDFIGGDLTDYIDYWPWSDFYDPVLDDPSDIFWSNFNSTFIGEFDRAFDEATLDYYGWGGPGYSPMMWDEPWADWYWEGDLAMFGYDLGLFKGYQLGWDAVFYSGADMSWNDSAAALDGYYASYFNGQADGFAEGQLDYLTDKIPDVSPPTPPGPTDAWSHAYAMDYHRYWSDFYKMGFRYEADNDNFNMDLFWDLYEGSWDTWFAGYVDGYDWHYWDGYWNGWVDQDNGWTYGTSYYPPTYWGDYWNSYDYGFENGMYEGYDQGYQDGYYLQNIGEQKISGFRDYFDNAYFEGFTNGVADSAASLPQDNTPILPYPSPATPYEDAANQCYDNQYRDGYDNGYIYETLVSSPNSLSWLKSVGPFYNMTLPDVQLDLLSGSLLPTPLMDMTTFTEIDFNLMDEYEFNWGAHDYWPFNDNLMSFMSFDAVDQDWIALDGTDQAYNESEGSPGINTTYDIGNQYFSLEFHINDTDAQIAFDAYFGYNTTTGRLLNVSAYVDFYAMTDMWGNIVLTLNEGKTELFTPTMPSPSSWTYLIDNFVFYYDIPPTAPVDFADGVAEFKSNGIASIGNPVLGVDMTGYNGMWAIADYTMYDPSNTSEPGHTEEYRYPLFGVQGMQLIPDWTWYDGLWMSVTSVLGHNDYLINAVNALAGQNINYNLLGPITFVPEVGSYYWDDSGGSTGLQVQYYYATLELNVEAYWEMLNGDYVWEQTTVDAMINAFIWIGIDANSGVVLGSGLKASFDVELTAVPDYGNNGAIAAYLEAIIGVNFATIPHIDALIGTLPTVGEYAFVSILSIIGLAGIASAVIFYKKK